MTVTIHHIPYQGWQDACQVTNGQAELIVTTLVGPRIIRFAFSGKENEFSEVKAALGLTGGKEWRSYGGHRLWYAPESELTYFPDNAPVSVNVVEANSIRIIQEPEPVTAIQKEIDLSLDPETTHVTVTHRLRNVNGPAIDLAPWALSVMAPGGTAILPLPPRGPHPQNLLPVNSLALWAYTDLADPRWTWGTKYILLRQDASHPGPQKIGAWLPDGWAAYARKEHLFVKIFSPQAGASYPDLGSSAELFTNVEMLEVETLGPSIRLQPGQSVEHREDWFLFDRVPAPQSDADVEAYILPLVQQAFKVVKSGEF
jgi:hypothetical protein